MTQKMFRRPAGDEGFSLMMTIGYTTIAMLVTVVLVTFTVRSLQSTYRHGTFEQSLSVAEAGVDRHVAMLQTARKTGSDAPSPSLGGGCNNGNTVTFGGRTGEAERVWATSELRRLADDSRCVQQIEGGEYVVLKPTDRTAVYALGAAPSFPAERHSERIIKKEFSFGAFRPGHAILTGSDLEFSGSVEVEDASDGDTANVHANGNITGINGSTEIEGTVSASGTLNKTSTGKITQILPPGVPKVTIPEISAREVHRAQAMSAEYQSFWFDLCPDGSMQRPATGGPCTNSVKLKAADYGWSKSGTTWSMEGKSGNPTRGIFYAHEADINIKADKSAWNATLIASAKKTNPNDPCSKTGGNITLKHTALQAQLPGIIALADADLTTDAQFWGANGFVLAGDQMDLQTSSAGITRGGVLAADQCPSGPGNPKNTIQGVTITYNPDTELPLGNVTRVGRWLEMVG